MQSQEFEIKILPDGRVEYTIKGIKGSACEELSALLEQIGKVEVNERTGDYYADESQLDVTIAGS